MNVLQSLIIVTVVCDSHSTLRQGHDCYYCHYHNAFAVRGKTMAEIRVKRLLLLLIRLSIIIVTKSKARCERHNIGVITYAQKWLTYGVCNSKIISWWQLTQLSRQTHMQAPVINHYTTVLYIIQTHSFPQQRCRVWKKISSRQHSHTHRPNRWQLWFSSKRLTFV